MEALLPLEKDALTPGSRSWRYFVWLRLNQALHLGETASLFSTADLFPNIPIFIIGAPRSGSTLLYQVLVEAFDVGYLSNLHCKFYGGPSLIERWIFPRLSRPTPDYASEHGRTRGRIAPSECGEYWYRFFPRQPQVISSLPEAQQQALRTAVSRLLAAAGRPFLFKNLMNSLRLQPLAQALPQARFIVIQRDPLANARSLLAARKRAYGDYQPWWSARPANVQDLERLPPHQQVVEQIIAIHEGIDAARASIGAHRFFDIRYEAFCQDVHGSLKQIDHFFAAQDIQLRSRPHNIPQKFAISAGGPLPPDLDNALRDYLISQQERLPAPPIDAHG